MGRRLETHKVTAIATDIGSSWLAYDEHVIRRSQNLPFLWWTQVVCISVVRKTSPNIFGLFRYACNRAWLVIPTKPQQSIVLQSCDGGNDASGCLAANECELINSSEYAARSAAFVLEVINHFWECRALRPRMSFETTNTPAMSLYFLLKVTSRSLRSNTGAGFGVSPNAVNLRKFRTLAGP